MKTPTPKALKTPAEKRAARKSSVAKPAVAVSAPTPATDPAPQVKGRLGLMVDLLARPDGATIVDLANATGWQDHSIRGAIAGALKKRGFAISSVKADGVRTYRLIQPSGDGG